MILSRPSRTSCKTKLKNPSNWEAQSRSISSYYNQRDTDNANTRCKMTSQSEWVLKWCGFFKPFLIARWLYISPLTASINVESSLTMGWAPESTLTLVSRNDCITESLPTPTTANRSWQRIVLFLITFPDQSGPRCLIALDNCKAVALNLVTGL